MQGSDWSIGWMGAGKSPGGPQTEGCYIAWGGIGSLTEERGLSVQTIANFAGD